MARGKDGSSFLANVVTTALYAPDGTVRGYSKVIRDITERKRAEEALRESEQRWATTLASIGDAVMATDVAGRITFMNEVAEALTGWTLGAAMQKPVQDVFHIINEETRRIVENPVARVLEAGMIVGLANHTLLVRKDGIEMPIDDSGAPIREEDGNTLGVVLVFRDISERKQAEVEREHLLDEVERRLVELDTIFNAIEDPMIAYNTDGTAIKANPAIVKTLGRDPAGMSEAEVAQQLAMRHPDGTLMQEMEIPATRALRGRKCQS